MHNTAVAKARRSVGICLTDTSHYLLPSDPNKTTPVRMGARKLFTLREESLLKIFLSSYIHVLAGQ